MTETVRVPASSANLGPGFDALGMALGIYLDLPLPAGARRCRSGRAGGTPIRSPPARQSDLADRAARWPQTPRETLPPIELDIHNDIPIGKGLGSSAAALTAGVVIADRLLGLGWKPLRILDEAARIEGHPDNVAACVLGSIVASAIDSGGVARAVRTGAARSVSASPSWCRISILPTAKARAVLPDCYSPRRRRLQRAALRAADRRPGHRTTAPSRRPSKTASTSPTAIRSCPAWKRSSSCAPPACSGCVLSGAGPPFPVFYERGYEQVCDLVRQIFALHGHQSEILLTQIAAHGYEVIPPGES